MAANDPRISNRAAWDRRARTQDSYAQTASAADLQNPILRIDECGWLEGNVRGKRVLCLAAGGGKHAAWFAAAGAHVTVVDLSPAMLELDRQVAARHGLNLQVVEASMDNLSPLGATLFEIVIQPVSTCYVPDIEAVYREVARITAPGGLYISQHKQPASLQASAKPDLAGYSITEPYQRHGPLPEPEPPACHRELGTVEFLHPWENLLGGLCRNGFWIEDLIEPRHAQADAPRGSLGHRSLYLPPFVTVKARRRPNLTASTPERKLWLPGGPSP